MRSRCVRMSSLLVIVCALGARAAAQPTYVERSSGLHTVTMEEGNTEIEFADVNQDGHPDIVSIGDHGSPNVNATEHGVMVWLNDGTAHWSLTQTGQFGYGGVAVGDVNNDGRPDVGYGFHHNYFAVGDFGDQILEVALGDGTGMLWTPWDDGLATNGETWGMFGTDFADVDNDGDLDLGAASFGGSNGCRVYLNNLDGIWTQSSALVGGAGSRQFVFGHVNGDGHADYAAAWGTATVRLGDGQGNFTVGDGNLPGSGARQGIALGDVNADGRDDLAYVNDAGGLEVYTLISPGVWQSLGDTLPASGSFDLTQIADMNRDGIGDLLAFSAGNPGSTQLFIHHGAGNWTLTTTVNHPQYDDAATFRAGMDLDHNGYPDFAVVGHEYVGGFPFAWRNKLRVYVEDTVPADTLIHPVAPRGGEVWIAGSVRMVKWHAARPPGSAPATVDIELSRLGPSGPYAVIADDIPNNGHYQFVVPPELPTSAQCVLRLTLNAGTPVVCETPALLTIRNPTPPTAGDLNCDGQVDFADINPFVRALLDPSEYASHHPLCARELADLNGDALVDFGDINPFVSLLVDRH